MKKMNFAPVVPFMKFERILNHLTFYFVFFRVDIVWTQPYPYPKQAQFMPDPCYPARKLHGRDHRSKSPKKIVSESDIYSIFVP